MHTQRRQERNHWSSSSGRDKDRGSTPRFREDGSSGSAAAAAAASEDALLDRRPMVVDRRTGLCFCWGVARRRGVDGGGGGGRVPSGILAGGERGRRLYNGGGWGRRGLRAVGDVGIRRGGEWDRVAERHGTAGGEEVGVEGLDASIPSHPARQRAALDFLSGFHGRTTTTEALTCGHRRRGGGGRGLRALGWRCIVVAG